MPGGAEEPWNDSVALIFRFFSIKNGNSNCDNSNCPVLGCVYKIKCNIFQEVYIGETSRTAHERLMEHNRYAANPGKYPDEALSQHHDTFHPGMSPDLVFSILDKELSTGKGK